MSELYSDVSCMFVKSGRMKSTLQHCFTSMACWQTVEAEKQGNKLYSERLWYNLLISWPLC